MKFALESLPAWGVWIEIFLIDLQSLFQHCRSPHGECGLKSVTVVASVIYRMSLPAWGVWIEIRSIRFSWSNFSVAPRMGSVD